MFFDRAMYVSPLVLFSKTANPEANRLAMGNVRSSTTSNTDPALTNIHRSSSWLA